MIPTLESLIRNDLGSKFLIHHMKIIGYSQCNLQDYKQEELMNMQTIYQILSF